METLSTKLARLRKAAGINSSNVFVPPNLTGLTLDEGVKRDHEVMSKACDTSEAESDSKIETPLWVLLMIYEKSRRECDIDYNKGLTTLIKWLGDIDVPVACANIYPELLGGWSTTKLATMLGTDTDIIIECLLTEVMPRMRGEK